ncbi:hypothetical protein BaRGS_00002360 [Batillaria attramentaria]|uniref:Uncharacterized protein n=1 Tax=Batillaria attramentaria TaxID=370345 RepID=A0ABD0M4D6_9CAEN
MNPFTLLTKPSLGRSEDNAFGFSLPFCPHCRQQFLHTEGQDRSVLDKFSEEYSHNKHAAIALSGRLSSILTFLPVRGVKKMFVFLNGGRTSQTV